MAKPIGTLGTVDTLTVGNRVLTDLTNLITLICNQTSNNNATFRLPTGTSGYVVTSGKTLKVKAIKLISNSTSQGQVALAQSDNDVGQDSATALTNAVFNGGSNQIRFATSGNGSSLEVAVNFSVSATKYLSVDGSGAGELTVIAYCYEE